MKVVSQALLVLWDDKAFFIGCMNVPPNYSHTADKKLPQKRERIEC